MNIGEVEGAEEKGIRPLVIVGAGGMGRETAWLVERINARKPTWNILGFVDDRRPDESLLLGYPYLGPVRSSLNKIIHEGIRPAVSVAIGDSKARFGVVSGLFNMGIRSFPALIDPDIDVHRSVNIGEGSIICPGVILTVNVVIGKFVIVNVASSISHESKLGDFSSVMTGVRISGNCRIGHGAYIGSGAVVLQGRAVGEAAVVGAGAVVTRDVEPRVVSVGIPARIQRWIEVKPDDR